MGRKSNQQRNLKQYQHTNDNDEEVEEEEEEEEEGTSYTSEFLEIIKFVIAIIYCGFPEILAQEFSILIGKKPPSYYFIVTAFNIIRSVIRKLAKNSAAAEKAKIPQNASVSVDGSWDHRRNGKLLIFDAICIQTGKIIDFEIRIKISSKRKGNSFISSKALEGEAFQILLPRLRSNNSIQELIKDGDLVNESIIEQTGWRIKVTLDTNHLLKHFDEHFHKLVSPIENKFRGISKKMLKKLKFILYSNTDKSTKLTQVQQMKLFILTQPFLKFGKSTTLHKWKHANEEDTRNCLDKVIKLCLDITSNFDRYHSTNLNESFHYVKSKFLPKEFNLGNTSDVRLYAAILQFNQPKIWLRDLYRYFHLNEDDLDSLEQLRLRARKNLKELRKDDDYIQKKMKEEEEANKEYLQLKEDIKEHIPIHS